MRFCLIISAWLLSGIITHAQSPLGIEMPKIIPPTPNAAAFEKFGSIPVDYSTGIPSIGYPFWSWSRGKLSIGLNMSYHAGGHKVEDMAPNTGLGWSLGGLFRISRTVRGIPDDHPTMGFCNTSVLPTVSTPTYDGNYYNSDVDTLMQAYFSSNIAINPKNSAYYELLGDILESSMDGEQDIFSYSINGKSGKFIIGKDKNPVLLEYSNVKIEPVFGSAELESFKVTDDNGIEYFFEHREAQHTDSYVDGDAQMGYSFPDVVSGWLVTKMIDPFAKDTVRFNYTDNGVSGDVQYEAGFSESESYHLTVEAGTCAAREAIGLESSQRSVSFIKMNDPLISEIMLPDGSKVFFQYNFNRDDLVNSKAMTGLTVKNLQNDIIKKYSLHYSYFSSGTGTYYYPSSVSGNDYNKRLRLDSIREISADSLRFKPTLFTYNSLQLNRRNSTNLDYWGYNVDPARNNSRYVPQIKLEGTEVVVSPFFGLYLDGADRKPDSIYAKAAVLEKITYPTKGFTSFSYESNRAFSSQNYYENKMERMPEWYYGDFNNAISVDLSSRSETPVEFYFKTVEFDPRPTPDPEAPVFCLEGSQDAALAKFEVRSTDNSVIESVEATYVEFLSGITKVIMLPVNKSYTIKFIYNTSDACLFSYPFKSYAHVIYSVPIHDKLAGGLRIKSIVSYDGISNSLEKQYMYNNPDNNSSASLSVVPNFGYYRTTTDKRDIRNQYCSEPTLIYKYIHRTSNPTATLNYFNGSPLIYTRVIEKRSDNSTIEWKFDPLTYTGGGLNGNYPYLPGQDFPNLSGLMTRQFIKDNNGNLVEEDSVSYKKVTTVIGNNNNRNIKAGTITSAIYYDTKYYVADYYYSSVTRAEDTLRIKKTYQGASALTTTDRNSYDASKYYRRTQERVNSEGKVIKSQFYYPFDYPGTTSLAYMTEKNILSPVIESIKSKLTPSVIQLARNVTNYQLLQSGVFPLPSNIQNSVLGNSLENALTYDAYDDKGNILQFTARSGVINSFIWQYKQNYPVAEVLNAKYNEIFFDSFEEGSGWDNNLTAYDNTKSNAGKLAGKIYKPTSGELYSHSTRLLAVSLPTATKFKYSGWIYSDGPVTEILLFMKRAGETGYYSYVDVLTTTTTGKWVYIEKEYTVPADVTQLNLRIDNNGGGTVWFDDLRLSPSKALMTTYTYTPLIGITSQCDPTNKFMFYKYDSFNRLYLVRDQDKNILKRICYNYAGDPVSCGTGQ